MRQERETLSGLTYLTNLWGADFDVEIQCCRCRIQRTQSPRLAITNQHLLGGLMPTPSYYIGIDQGYSSTRLAFVSRERELVHADEEGTDFSTLPLVPIPTDASLQDRYRHRLSELMSRSPTVTGTSVNVYLATNGGLAQEHVYHEIEKQGLQILGLEHFSDVHAHYGVTDMPGECATYVCGSYYNLMYYDGDNNVTCLSDRYWDATSWGKGLCAYSLGNLILDIYAESSLKSNNRALIQEVENRLGPRENDSIYEYVRKARLESDRGYVMQLASLASRLRNMGQIGDYLRSETHKSILALRILEEHAKGPISAVFLGGSVFVHNEFLVDAFRQNLRNVRVECARGNPAAGAVHFRLRNPFAEISTSQSKSLRC